MAEECRRVVNGAGRTDEASVEEHEVLRSIKTCGHEHPSGSIHQVAVIADRQLELRATRLVTP